MKIFITGASGFIGAHTALALINAGHDCHLLVRNLSLAQQYFQQHSLRQPTFIVGDMLDTAKMKQVMVGFDTVIHAAALVDLDPRHAEKTLQGNLHGISSVIGSACELGIKKILYVSSISVMLNPKETLVDESADLIQSKDAYSRSKIACEERVREYQKQGCPIVITYPAGVIGPDDPKLSQTNAAILELMMVMVPLTSAGIQLVDVRDVAQIHAQLLETDVFEHKEDARFIIGGHFVPWRDIADMLGGVTSVKLKCIPMPGFVLRLSGILMDLVRVFIPVQMPITIESTRIATQSPEFSSQKILAVVKTEFRPAYETIKDACLWIESSSHFSQRQKKS